MKYFTSLFTVSLFSVALSAPASVRCNSNAQIQTAKAIYFSTNSPDGNNIVAMNVEADGTLCQTPNIIPTGGKGSLSKKGDGTVAEVDPLFSQGAITLGGTMLFAVNAGSNTLSMFNIDPLNPTNLTLVGKPVDTMGEFPMSVTFSQRLGAACVLNGGQKNGIACFTACPQTGLTPMDQQIRPLDEQLTTPPTGPEATGNTLLNHFPYEKILNHFYSQSYFLQPSRNCLIYDL